MNVKEGPAGLRKSAPLGRHLMLGLNRQKHNGSLELIEQYHLCKFLQIPHAEFQQAKAFKGILKL